MNGFVVFLLVIMLTLVVVGLVAFLVFVFNHEPTAQVFGDWWDRKVLDRLREKKDDKKENKL